MIDHYTPDQNLILKDLIFYASQLQVVSKGTLIKEVKNIDCIFHLKPANTSIETASIVRIEKNPIPETLLSSISFDSCYSAHDRVILCTLANTSNLDNYIPYHGFKSMSKRITQGNKTFSWGEPFACSLFTNNNDLLQISFSLGTPECQIKFFNGSWIEPENVFKSATQNARR